MEGKFPLGNFVTESSIVTTEVTKLGKYFCQTTPNTSANLCTITTAVHWTEVIFVTEQSPVVTSPLVT
uniref:Uncharacterized protein n=1 Tax=Ciona intestinalis TaxID=7719 RepID=F6RUX5_CIOIN